MLRVTITDQDTNRQYRHRVTTLRAFDWIEGNWSCDCNRGATYTGNRGVCDGTIRYVVSDVSGDPAQMEGYTTEEFIIAANRKYVIRSAPLKARP